MPKGTGATAQGHATLKHNPDVFWRRPNMKARGVISIKSNLSISDWLEPQMSIFQACIPSTIMSLLICLLAVLSVAIASPVPDAESNFPSPLKGIADFNFGSYPPPPQDVGGIIASQGASVLGDNQDLSTGWDNLALIPQSDTSAYPMLDSNGNLIVQSYYTPRKGNMAPKTLIRGRRSRITCVPNAEAQRVYAVRVQI